MSNFPKTLIANRGEIAISVMRATNKLGKQPAAVRANEGKISQHLFNANETYKIADGLGQWPHTRTLIKYCLPIENSN